MKLLGLTQSSGEADSVNRIKDTDHLSSSFLGKIQLNSPHNERPLIKTYKCQIMVYRTLKQQLNRIKNQYNTLHNNERPHIKTYKNAKEFFYQSLFKN